MKRFNSTGYHLHKAFYDFLNNLFHSHLFSIFILFVGLKSPLGVPIKLFLLLLTVVF